MEAGSHGVTNHAAREYGQATDVNETAAEPERRPPAPVVFPGSRRYPGSMVLRIWALQLSLIGCAIVLLVCTVAAGGLVPGATAADVTGLPNLGSGTYTVYVRNGGTLYKSTWTLEVNKTTVRGSSVWTCCPGARTDQLRGSVAGNHVIITRYCVGQGAPPPCQQRYTGDITPSGSGKLKGVLKGTFSGDGAVVPSTWETHVNTRSPIALPPEPQGPATPQVATVLQLKSTTKPASKVVALVQRGGKGPTKVLHVGDLVNIGDVITTDSTTLLGLEFTIGGRTGIDKNAQVTVVTERTVKDTPRSRLQIVTAPIINPAIPLNWMAGMWRRAEQLKTPLYFQDGNGVMSIKG